MPRQTNSNFRTSNRGFSINRSNNNISNKPYKDPDVWDSPPPVDKRQSVNKVQRPNNYNQPASKNNQIKNAPNKKKPALDANGKKTFLADRYPDGNGPDTNLI